MTVRSQPLFLFGAGFSARALAATWDGPVIAVQRSKPGREPGQKDGMTMLLTTDEAAISEAIQGAHALISAPPTEAGCPAIPVLKHVAETAASLTYLSTTGVYGDLSGGWAFEWSEVNPKSERGLRRVAAEDAWRALRGDVRIVRLPSIYGPGRSALDRVRSGKARRIIKPGQVFSRVHVEDIAGAVKALMLNGATGVFNLCDEEAAPPQDVTAYAATLLGAALPPEIAFETADLSEMACSFYSECKRVSNARIKAATGWKPTYPTYREGLSAIAKAED